MIIIILNLDFLTVRTCLLNLLDLPDVEETVTPILRSNEFVDLDLRALLIVVKKAESGGLPKTAGMLLCHALGLNNLIRNHPIPALKLSGYFRVCSDILPDMSNTSFITQV